VPREIDSAVYKFIAPVIDDHQFPLVLWPSLCSERVKAAVEIVAARIVGANDDREHVLATRRSGRQFRCKPVLLIDSSSHGYRDRMN
jgi:hypothetical protein